MKRIMKRLCVFVWMAVALATTVFADRAVSPVKVAMRTTVDVPSAVVHVGQIATLTGGPRAVRSRIAALDIADMPSAGRSVTVSRNQVDVRLKLAGLEAGSYVLDGAETVRLRMKKQTYNDQGVLDAVRLAISEQLDAPPDELEIRLTQPIRFPVLSPAATHDVLLEPHLPELIQLGRLHLKIAIHANGRLVAFVPVLLEVRRLQTVARTLHTVPRDEIFSKDNVELVTLPLTDQFPANPQEHVWGQAARRTLRPGELVNSQDIATAKKEKPPVLVRPRDTVRIVARRGGLTVIISSAESLQQGRLGDLIRVRNLQSKRVITGRVASRDEVEVSF